MLDPHGLSRWDGKAWRTGDPLDHDRQTTVADVVRYETEELGNKDVQVWGGVLDVYGDQPARRTIWVTGTRQAARRYRGTPEQLEIHGVVVASDGDNGFLILQD